MNEIGEGSQISWESNKLKSVVKSAVALEILAQAECWTKYYIMTIRNPNNQWQNAAHIADNCMKQHYPFSLFLIKDKIQYCLTPTNDGEKGYPTNKLDWYLLTNCKHSYQIRWLKKWKQKDHKYHNKLNKLNFTNTCLLKAWQ